MKKTVNNQKSATANLTLRQLIALVEEKNTPKTSYVVAEYQDASYDFKVFSNGTLRIIILIS